VEHFELPGQGIAASSGEALTDTATWEFEDPIAPDPEPELATRDQADGEPSSGDGTSSGTTHADGEVPRELNPPPWLDTWGNLLDWEMLRRLYFYFKSFG
jgi:hypothetical protein